MRKLVGKVAAVAALGAAIGFNGINTAQAQSYNWGGLYLGANAGWAQTDFDWAFNPPIGGAAHQSYSLSNSDGIFGLQVGVQHQWGNILVGIEGAYSGASGRAKETDFGNNTTLDSEAKLRGLYTIGPRIGWAADRWLLFASGGFAYGNIDTRAISKATGAASFVTSDSHSGWYIGGGLEYAITENWILGAEYQHVSLDTVLHCPNATCLGAAGGFVDRDISAESDIIRARLSFKFGRAPEPVTPLK